MGVRGAAGVLRWGCMALQGCSHENSRHCKCASVGWYFKGAPTGVPGVAMCTSGRVCHCKGCSCGGEWHCKGVSMGVHSTARAHLWVCLASHACMCGDAWHCGGAPTGVLRIVSVRL